MKYSKYYIPFTGIYHTYKDIEKLNGTPHFNLTAIYHAIVIASIITVPMFIYLFR